MFSYRFFLKQAWNITKRYRHLWFFGIFAALTAIGGEYQIIAQSANNNLGGNFINGGIFILYNLFNPSLYTGIHNLAAANPSAFWSLISVFALAAVLIIIMVYLAIISQAALVEQSARIILSKKKKEKLSIGEGMVSGRRHFWHVLGLNITNSLVITLCSLLISLPLLFLFITDAGILTLLYLILFVIFVPVSLIIAFISKYAIAARVLENKSFVASLEQGWQIFKQNWLVSLEMALILFIINFAASLVTLIIIFLFLIPLLVLSIQLSLPFLIALSFLLILITMIFAASLLNTFQISSWTGLFLHLENKKGLSKLERLFHRSR